MKKSKLTLSIIISLSFLILSSNISGQNIRIMNSKADKEWDSRDLEFSTPRLGFQNSVSGNFDGLDGDEVFMFSKSGRNVYYYRDSDGNWEEKWNVFLKKSVNGYDYVVSGDFNSDGKDDLFFLSREGQNRFFIKQEGRFNWKMEEFSFDPKSVNGYDKMVVGKFNLDKHDDIFLLSKTGVNRFLIKDSNGLKWSIPDFSFHEQAVNGYDHVVSGDFNLDGRGDLFLLSREGHNRFILKDTDGFDWTVNEFTFNMKSVNGYDFLLVGDFNHDEREDLFFLAKHGGNRMILKDTDGFEWTTTDFTFNEKGVNGYMFINSGNFNTESTGGTDIFLIPQKELNIKGAYTVYGSPGQNIDIYEAYNLSGTIYVKMLTYELKPAECKFWNKGLFGNKDYGFHTGEFIKGFSGVFKLRAGHIQDETIFIVTENANVFLSIKAKY